MRLLSCLSIARRRATPLLATLLLALCVPLAHAQSNDDGADTAPPDRVARLSYLAGDVGLLPTGAKDWSSANLNRPLTTGDKLSTTDGARAELELGGGALRMDGDTDFGVLNLSDNLAQVELTRGTLNLAVHRLDQGQSYEIDTPTLALVVTRPGTFRIDVDNDGNGTRVTVFDGQATVYGENNAQRDVLAGRHYQFDDPSLGALMITDIQGEDAFDAWCDQRDRRYAQATTTRYVSDDMVGAQDLDQYGRWQATTDYGPVWYPSAMPVGWAPYRDGHWAWIAPWGWTWVDDSPWGFAPYHYGRWAMIGGAWGWIPGPIMPRPVYAPALVAFVGGGGWSVGIGIGAAPVGWFPLGPGEIYNPWYHVNRNYYQRVNITNIYVHNTYNRTTIINNINRQYGDYRNGRLPPNLHYANRATDRGFTAMPGNAFAAGQNARRDAMRIDPRRLSAAPVLAHGVTSVRPTPASFAPRGNPARLRALPTAAFQRDVVARTPPPAALAQTRAPFANAPARTLATPRPFTHVRVLNARGAEPGAAHALDASARPVNAPRGMPASPVRVPADAAPRVPQPPASRFTPRNETAEPLPAGALPSSRFAHPGALPDVAPIRRMDGERPPRAGQLGPDRASTPERLPQPARIEPAAPQDTLGNGVRGAPDSRFDRPREPQPNRFQRNDEPAPQPAMRDTPRPMEQAPRFQPPREQPLPQQPYAPAPRQAEPRPDTPRYEAPREPDMPRYETPREPAMPRYEAPRPAQMPQRYEPPRPAQEQRRAEPPPRKAPPKRDEQER